MINTIGLFGVTSEDPMPLLFSFFICIIGFFIGLLFFFLFRRIPNMKRYLFNGVPGFIFLLIVVAYFIGGFELLVPITLNLLKIGIGTFFCFSSILGTYGILNRRPRIIYAAGGFIFFVFIFSRVGFSAFIPFISQISVFMLFVVLLLCYFELGGVVHHLHSSFVKIHPMDNTDEEIYRRFNHVFTKYLFHILLLFCTCYILTFTLVFALSNNIRMSILFQQSTGMNVTSHVGLWFLIGVCILGAFLLYLLIPREKKAVPQSNSFPAKNIEHSKKSFFKKSVRKE